MQQSIATTLAQLELNASLASWSAFREGGAPPPELEATWSRSRRYGALNGATDPRDLMIRGESLRLRAEPLQHAARLLPEALEAVSAKALRDYVVLLADPDGLVVHTVGGGAFADEAQRVRLIAGALWNEETRGTNAIGTAARENAIVSVYGSAHYGAAFHGLVCYGVPLHGPDGTLVGILDATSLVGFADARAQHALVSTAEELTRMLSVAELPRPRRVVRQDAFAPLFTQDAATRSAVEWARKIARSDLAVVVLGETGSGKELIAQAIHAESVRSSGPFVAVNCGAIAPQLLESELFGYAPFAFTGAERQGRQGLIHAATGGTLFLDEVADMPATMQVALLRVLETGTYRRVGETVSATADVRMVCATSRDLPALVDRGEFRRDLYFRLKGATVVLPPLRQRTDIVALAEHLLAGRKLLSTEMVEALLAHTWPGNVRELKSALDVAVVLADDNHVLTAEHLPPDLALQSTPEPTSFDAVEAEAVRRALSEADGNISAAANRLGVARSTLYRMMRRHNVKAD